MDSGQNSLNDLTNLNSQKNSQAQTDELIAYVNEQIELLAFDEPDPQLLRQMIQGLSDPRRAVRLSLINAFSEIGEPATPFLLEGLATHPDPIVRRACCNAMTNLGDETAVSGLVMALAQDQEMSVKSAAAGALAKIGAPAFESVREILASTSADESAKGHAAWAIATMSAEVREQLYQSRSDPSPSVRVAVVGAIAQLAQAQLAQAQLAQTQLAQAQCDLSNQLGEEQHAEDQPSEDNLRFLLEALQDPAPDVRIEAIAHLARLNYQPAYQPLLACLQDAEADVRKAAILALGKLSRRNTIDAIAPLQQDLNPAVQRVAALVIKQLQAQASKAI